MADLATFPIFGRPRSPNSTSSAPHRRARSPIPRGQPAGSCSVPSLSLSPPSPTIVGGQPSPARPHPGPAPPDPAPPDPAPPDPAPPDPAPPDPAPLDPVP